MAKVFVIAPMESEDGCNYSQEICVDRLVHIQSYKTRCERCWEKCTGKAEHGLHFIYDAYPCDNTCKAAKQKRIGLSHEEWYLVKDARENGATYKHVVRTEA